MKPEDGPAAPTGDGWSRSRGGAALTSAVVRNGPDEGWNSVKVGFERLAALDRRLVVHGSRAHRYRLFEPARGEQLRLAEARLNVTLPKELTTLYRHFGNGLYGPGYGIEQVENLAAGEHLLAAELPLGEFHDTDWGLELNTGSSLNAWDLPGVVELIQEGCGGYYGMVLRGPHRGRVVVATPESDVVIRPREVTLASLYGDHVSLHLARFDAAVTWLLTATTSGTEEVDLSPWWRYAVSAADLEGQRTRDDGVGSLLREARVRLTP